MHRSAGRWACEASSRVMCTARTPHALQDQCNTLYLLLKDSGLDTWYDMQVADLMAEGMERGISQSRVVLVFLRS